MEEDQSELPTADPAFARHFTDPVYDDEAGEFAPFGTDEGWDLLHEWADRRDELGPHSTVDSLLEGDELGDVVSQLDVPEGGGVPVPAGQVDAATIVIGAAFTLLRLTGHIDDAGKRKALRAIDILLERYDSPAELVRQRSDLATWRG